MIARTAQFAAVVLIAVETASAARCRQSRECNATDVTEGEICNFHKVDEDLYRGGRTSCSGFAKLRGLGIRTFIDLGGADSALGDCDAYTSGLGSQFVRFHISPVQTALTGVSDEKLRKLFAFMQAAPKPMFVSCALGRDRTGLIVMLYRARLRELPLDQAEKEAIHYGLREGFLGLRRTLRLYKDPPRLAALPAPTSSAKSAGGECFPSGFDPPPQN